MLDERKGVFLSASLCFVDLFRIRKTNLNLRRTMTNFDKKLLNLPIVFSR